VTSRYDVVRYDANGTLDTSFGVNGIANARRGIGNANYYSLTVGSDGKIVIGGYSYQGGARRSDFAVARLNSDGTLDTTFDGDGKATIDFGSTSDYGYSVAVQGDGKIVVGGRLVSGRHGHLTSRSPA
jgi:serralysin